MIDKQQFDFSHCWECNKRIGLLGFKCRCNYIFCSKHRHSDTHSCSFNHKEYHKQILEKRNPIIVYNKINKI